MARAEKILDVVVWLLIVGCNGLGDCVGPNSRRGSAIIKIKYIYRIKTIRNISCH